DAGAGRQSFMANGQPVEWHAFSDANYGIRHPDNDGWTSRKLLPQGCLASSPASPAICPVDRERARTMRAGLTETSSRERMQAAAPFMPPRPGTRPVARR